MEKVYLCISKNPLSLLNAHSQAAHISGTKPCKEWDICESIRRICSPSSAFTPSWGALWESRGDLLYVMTMWGYMTQLYVLSKSNKQQFETSSESFKCVWIRPHIIFVLTPLVLISICWLLPSNVSSCTHVLSPHRCPLQC